MSERRYKQQDCVFFFALGMAVCFVLITVTVVLARYLQ